MEKLIEQLQKEKEICQSSRQNFILKKLTFIATLFGVSSINFAQLSFYEILYIIPVIALGYDIYILTEDFKIKRIGEFLRTQESEMQAWENWVAAHPNRYASPAAPFFTFITIAGSGMLLLKNKTWETSSERPLFVVWFSVLVIANCMLLIRSGKTRKLFR